MSVLSLRGVQLSMGGRLVLDDVSLDVEEREVVVLAGPSGSGKTSLLRVVAGLVAPDAGRVRLRGVEVSAGGRVLVPPEARGLGMVFQGLALWPHLSVRGNLLFALRAGGLGRSEAEGRVEAMLGRVGLARAGDRAPGTLSGGEQQRVALARALVTEPDLLLFDEALGGLDVVLKREMLALLREVLPERGVAMLHVTHDPLEAGVLADRMGRAAPSAGRSLRSRSPSPQPLRCSVCGRDGRDREAVGPLELLPACWSGTGFGGA